VPLPDVPNPREADVHLERDAFFRTLLRHLTGALEDVVGVRDASGLVSVVGQRMGDDLGAEYKRALGVERLPPEQLGEVLVDLKRRIGGDFRVVEQTADHIVFANRTCPFGEKVVGRPSLCMMTSNVFGLIASDSAGYAKVAIERAIARGDAGCLVIVYLRPSGRAAAAEGREYVRE
jgi:hypothetical protein